MNKAQLEYEYSPSRWSKRYSDPDEVIREHIKTVTAASEKVLASIPHAERKYGLGTNQVLSEFGGEIVPRDAPILVYIHGGYWQELERKLSFYPVGPLFEVGIRVIVLGYDLAPSVTPLEILEEMKQAAIFILNLAQNYKSKGVWFSGHSAGAHLASSLLREDCFNVIHEQKSLIKGMVLISGVYDTKPLIPTYINDVLKLNEETAAEFSIFPDTLITENMHFIIAVGEEESNEFKRQSKEMFKVFKKTSNAEFYEVKQSDHFFIVENLQDKDNFLTKKIVSSIQQTI